MNNITWRDIFGARLQRVPEIKHALQTRADKDDKNLKNMQKQPIILTILLAMLLPQTLWSQKGTLSAGLSFSKMWGRDKKKNLNFICIITFIVVLLEF